MCERLWIWCICLALLAGAGAVYGQAAAPDTWLTPLHHNFGRIPRGQPAIARFELRNDGAHPLLIDNVRTPCGCTAVDWPEAPIAPRHTATILVEYNAAQSGYFYKAIKVFFRGQRLSRRLSVEGIVE